MSALFPDLVRAIVSIIGNVLLMISLLQPKYSKKVTRLAMLGVLGVDLSIAIYCYVLGDLTLLSKIDAVLLAVLCFVVRPLFKESIMQWFFSYITVKNISDMVIVLSFDISRIMPYPVYSNSLVRLILFAICIYVLNRHIKPLYRQTVEHWTAFLAVALAICLTFTYYVVSTDDIVQMLTDQKIPLLFVIAISISAYGSIFLSMYILKREYGLKEENMRMQSDKEYLSLSAKLMIERLQLMDEMTQKSRLVAHDRRHFNNTVLELLEQGKTNEAMTILRKQTKAENPLFANRNYCENTVVNAAVCHYGQMAEKAGIRTDIRLDIPAEISVDSVELAMVISNFMENAIHGCMKIEKREDRGIRFTCRKRGRLLIEIDNTCSPDVTLDEKGLPYTTEEGHGLGSRSVLAFVKQYEGELLYRVENGIFQVRLLI